MKSTNLSAPLLSNSNAWNSSSCLKIDLMCLKQPSAMSISSAYVLPLNTGCGAFSKNLVNGKCSFTFPNPHPYLNKNHYNRLLPPANEVWGKVMFLHPYVILLMGSWGLCLGGGLCPGGSLSGVSLSTSPPPYGKERAVRILLKCILVTIISTSMDNLNDLTGNELEKKEIPRLQWNCLLPTMITGKRIRSF